MTNQLALDRINTEKTLKTGRLNLGRCGLDHIPEEVFEMTWLEELILSNRVWDRKKGEWITPQESGPYNLLRGKLPKGLQRLTVLKNLHLGGSGDIEIRWGLSNSSLTATIFRDYWHIENVEILKSLPQLKSLALGYSRINDISFLKGLTQLQSLDLNDNRISDISSLKGLTQLQSLDLRYNSISDIRFLKGLTNLQSLDLSHNSISDIRFLKGLTNLQSLYLRYNSISDIRFLKGLTNLQSLDLSHNSISDISFLKGLTNLQSLNISYTSISDISFLRGLTNLQSLNISYTSISDISFLKGLTNLQSLDLSHNSISDISFLKGLTNLQSLYLNSNNIRDISFLKGLTNLQSLYLIYTSISDISFLQGLTNLQRLDLSYTSINDISFLQGLTHLQRLDLSYTSISDITFLKRLTNLQSLDLSSNRISDIRFLKEMTHLQSLDLSHNSISDIRFLKGLTNLQSLYLSNNSISDISFLQRLTNLQSLDLRSNSISDISFLQGLTNLQSLDLSFNNISNYSFLQEMPHLRSLYLSDNNINDISFLEGLTNLQSLALHNNSISNISLLKTFKNLTELYFYSNPIPKFPKALLGNSEFNDCLKDIQSWWATTSDSLRCQNNKTIKLLLTGNGNTGKSSILCALKNGRCTCPKGHHSTHGIKLEKIELDGITFQIWDFAGQEIYHGTHQLFMSSEAVQVIVFDPETEDYARKREAQPDRINEQLVRDHQLEYWLETSKKLSPDSRFIVVQNKKDLHPNIDRTAKRLASDEDAEFLQISAITGEGLKRLKTRLIEAAEDLNEYDMLMPQSWAKVRDFFINNQQQPKKQRQRLMDMATFEQLCRDCGLPENLEKTIPTLRKLLHHNGHLYYNEEHLGDTIIADQEWALEAIYKVLDRKGDFYELMTDDLKGKVRVKTLFRHFGKAYQLNEKWLFLQFMESCKLCFRLRSHKEEGRATEKSYYIFTEFLPKEPSHNCLRLWTQRRMLGVSQLVYRRRYTWLSYYQIQRFIVALGQKTELDNIWRTGILIGTPQGYFQVVADLNNHSIEIHIEEKAKEKWLTTILEEWEGKGNVDKALPEWELREDGTFRKIADLEELKAYHRRQMEKKGKWEDLETVRH